MATQTASDDVQVTWTSPSGNTQSAYDDVLVTWLDGNQQQAFANVTVNWTNAAYKFYRWDGSTLSPVDIGVWDGSAIQWLTK